MTGQPPESSVTGAVTVRYWAAAKSAAGVDADVVEVAGPTTLAAVLGEVLRRHDGSPRFEGVVGVCSVLLGDRPVGAGDPEEITVLPGDVLQLLPPFAGG
ncbi:MAG TPA: MoaD/ThiS family protein [Nocardioidaceae bacterium]|nr:MoaD/ThiS family protein [Nocardioidaceae bacterium]